MVVTVSDRDARLTKKQLDALHALAVSSTTKEAAEKAGVNERTLRRWLASETFMRRYREQSREVSGQALSALRSAQVQAVEVLREGLTSSVPAVRVRSASRLLEYGLRIRDHDIEERLAELERRADTWQG